MRRNAIPLADRPVIQLKPSRALAPACWLIEIGTNGKPIRRLVRDERMGRVVAHWEGKRVEKIRADS